MKIKTIFRIGWVLLLLACALFFVIPAVNNFLTIPENIFLTQDSSKTIDFKLPGSLKVESDAMDVLNFEGTSLSDEAHYSLSGPVTISPKTSGNVSVSFDLFGTIPIKQINITVGEEVLLYPGGQSIGIMLHTKGALVVGSADVELADGSFVNPAQEAGLKAGDIIMRANNIEIENASHLSQLINENTSDTVLLTVKRGNNLLSLTLHPVKDKIDGTLRLGVWVRDSTAGVGTLTFYEPETQTLAGLGHAITDVDTGEILSVKNGEIIESEIFEIIKGEEGAPGELRGIFDPLNDVIGSLNKNTSYGIYGNGTEPLENELYPEPLIAASRSEVVEGPATLLCSLSEKGVAEYSCSITKAAQQSYPEQKSFVVTITDEDLLNATGGIVQGMSGSPIIQNGKLIGAVTHVFIDDPTKGYGIYIDWMLAQID